MTGAVRCRGIHVADLREIRAVFDEPGLGRQISAIQADAGRRVVRSRRPDRIVKSVRVQARAAIWESAVPIEGSILMFWARPGSDIIPRLEEACQKGDEGALGEVHEIIAGSLADEPIPTLDAAADAVLSSPMHSDVRYGTKVLARTLTLPEGLMSAWSRSPTTVVTSMSGTSRSIQYHQAGEAVEYPTLVVMSPAVLSEVERRALEAVPADQIGINIGEASCCPAVTALVLIAVALATNAGIWQEIGEQMNEVHLSEDQVERLGPMASAQELVALRREIFASHGF